MSPFVLSAVVVFLFLLRCVQDLSAASLNSTDASVQGNAGGNFRIVGGKNCDIEQHPYVVLLVSFVTGNFYCGGSLIRWNWVLTAAHCFPSDDDKPSEKHKRDFVKGGRSLSRGRESLQMKKIKQIYGHPQFKRKTLANDIAMVRLRGNFVESSFVQLAKLPPRSNRTVNADTEPECKTALIMGWGSTDARAEKKRRFRSKVSLQLQCVELPVVKNRLCQLRVANWIDNQVVCTMYEPGGKDGCQGDSGGPLTCSDKPDTVIGIVSGGRGCAMPNMPATFTRVDQYLDFIERCLLSGTSPRSPAQPLLLDYLSISSLGLNKKGLLCHSVS